ncbi:MAG: MerR family transcriptional regulator [Candidatus Entotheonella factor]|uniref:MerR family transcriptional regulator n=1 Tax=Entotheonella factor TaxID=1429438 RepID=W4LVU5_ENTF1|nr:MAG: MerR family transcriptional regulator [Candidatus Entotheonella factor]
MLSEDHPSFTISTLASMLDIHPQTLRLYERRGFVTPARSKGNNRMYSWRDVQTIRLIVYLTRERGVNLAGVELILGTQRKIDALHQDIEHLRQRIIEHARRTVVVPQTTRAVAKTSARALIKVQSQSPSR